MKIRQCVCHHIAKTDQAGLLTPGSRHVLPPFPDPDFDPVGVFCKTLAGALPGDSDEFVQDFHLFPYSPRRAPDHHLIVTVLYYHISRQVRKETGDGPLSPSSYLAGLPSCG